MPWYEYSPEPGGDHLSPIIEILLWHGAQRVRMAALVDSGADTSLVDASYAPLLGLNREDAVEDHVILADGGSVPCLTWPDAQIEFEFAGDRFPFAGSFLEFPPGAEAISVVGRADFFERFIVQFWDAQLMFNLDLSPDYPRELRAEGA